MSFSDMPAIDMWTHANLPMLEAMQTMLDYLIAVRKLMNIFLNEAHELREKLDLASKSDRYNRVSQQQCSQPPVDEHMISPHIEQHDEYVEEDGTKWAHGSVKVLLLHWWQAITCALNGMTSTLAMRIDYNWENIAKIKMEQICCWGLEISFRTWFSFNLCSYIQHYEINDFLITGQEKVAVALKM